MFNPFAPLQKIRAEVFMSMPDKFRKKAHSAWADPNRQGAQIECFLEGPSFDREGNLWFVDIPFGRIFRISKSGSWDLVTQYDGWPNGLKFHKDGRAFICCYKQGLLSLDTKTGKIENVLGSMYSEGFKGLNDLHFASNGDLYFTDQGQTGLHDPTGRLFRLRPSGQLDVVLQGIPSPNGLVMNLDETAVYLAVTRDNAIWRVPLLADGTATKVGVYIHMSGGGGPDGVALDAEGGLAVCHVGFGAVWVFSPRGEPLYRIDSPEGLYTTNCAYGDHDRRTLYVVESRSGCILKARLPVAGRPMYSHN
jgi:gluconolactonase